MRFLRSVTGYRRIDKKRNSDIRQDLNIYIFSLGLKIKEYQQNCLEHVSRMPNYPIPPKMFNSLKERERQRSITKDKER
jgi:hypothetical protein